MAKKYLIVANWKSNKTKQEARDWSLKWAEYTSWLHEHINEITAVVAMPFTLLQWNDGSHWDLLLSAQDVSPFPDGAYTGEISARMLTDLDVKYCLIGHSERRKYFGETTEIAGKKLDQAIKNKITPIICAQTIEEIPENIRNYSPEQYVIMYEPSEAISTEGQYHSESPENVQRTLTNWQEKLPQGVRFLYGGSINPNNAHQILAISTPLTSLGTSQQLVSGFVVGHASLDPETFFSIIKQCITPDTSL